MGGASPRSISRGAAMLKPSVDVSVPILAFLLLFLVGLELTPL
jgi:hypothetical protein